MTRKVIAVGEEPPAQEQELEPASPTAKGRPAANPAGLPAKANKGNEKRFSQDRFLTINAFVDVTMERLERADLAVWLALWRDTKPDGLARTSQADLARRVGCNTRTVRRALTKLKNTGLVSVVRQGGVNRGMSVYQVRPLAAEGT